jgi:hypothetical protein
LSHFAARAQLAHAWLDVENGCPLDGVEARDVQAQPLHSIETADGRADAIRAVLASLCEDSDLRPFGVVPRMASTLLDYGRVDLVED